MNTIDMDRQIRLARKEYADTYDQMRWLSPSAAASAENIRQELLTEIFSLNASAAGWMFSDTKLFTHDISPGCRLCGQGLWSCLFINGICNASCFYCPSEQKDNGPPVTSTVEFAKAQDYADYVSRFNIQGVGFSGGEPLMTFDRVVEYLETVKTKVSHPVHTWMYTNGILATQDRMKILRDNGLDEIRFDLSADRYRLDSLKMAVGVIPTVTVEMPAIPEDIDQTKDLIKELYSLGANFLNLHQIRSTLFNRSKLIERGYTFLNGPGLSTLETEFTALELINHALEKDIRLPINYCSFTFRHQFQKAAARSRNAAAIKLPWEDITSTGFLRTLMLKGPVEKINRVCESLKTRGEYTHWQMGDKQDTLKIPARLWPMVDFSGLSLKITYSSTALRSAPSFRYPFTEIRLNEDKKLIIEKDNRHPGILLENDAIHQFAADFLKLDHIKPAGVLAPKISAEIESFESFTPGLSPYF